MTKTFTRRAALAISGLAGLALLLPVPGAAMAGTAGIHVGGAWARPSIGDLDRSAAYFEIMNHGKAADRLLSAKTGISEKTELHATSMENGVARMRHLEDGIALPAGATVTFEPGGNHVMLLGLKEQLKEGASFPLTLVFEKAGEVTVEVSVRKSAASGHDAHHGHHGHHKH